MGSVRDSLATLPDEVFPADPVPSYVGAHQIVAVLGESAETEVLLATTRGPRGFSRPVVIKRLRANRDVEITGRYLAREAVAHTRLNHPNIVRLYEFLEEEGQLALVLEYVPGISLSKARSLLQQRREALSDECVLYVMSHVFAALAAAHAARDPWTSEFVPVIHRDVSPSNVLLAWDGSVKLADFGIARLAGLESDTRAGLLKGTYGYMAPEQVLGDPITPRTDIYSACLLLRELLLRRRTFVRGDTPELEFLQLMARPILDPIESLRTGVPPEICRALRTGLRLNPDERTVTAGELRDLLAGAIQPREARKQLVATLADVRPPDVLAVDAQNATTYPRDARETMPGPRGPESSVSDLIDPPQTTAPPIPLPVLPIMRRRASYTAAKWALLAGVSTALVVASLLVARREPEVGAELGPLAFTGGGEMLGPPAAKGTASGAGNRWLANDSTATGAGAAISSANRWLAKDSSPAPMHSAATAVHNRWPANDSPPPSANGPATNRWLANDSPPPSANAPATNRWPANDSPPPSPSATTGILRTPSLPDSHRVFLGARVIGATGESIPVRCGTQPIRIGSHGRMQSVNVPCGGEVVVHPKW